MPGWILSTLPPWLVVNFNWLVVAAGVVALLVCAFYAIGRLAFPSLWRRRSQKRRIRSARHVIDTLRSFEHDAQRFAYLRKIDPFVFEELILEAFERRQFKIQRGVRYTGDGGIDGQFWSRHGDLYLIQAKRYSSHISAQHVRDFSKLVSMRKCKGVFVHTGRTGSMARTLAKENPAISIISGKRLLKLLEPLEQQAA